MAQDAMTSERNKCARFRKGGVLASEFDPNQQMTGADANVSKTEASKMAVRMEGGSAGWHRRCQRLADGTSYREVSLVRVRVSYLGLGFSVTLFLPRVPVTRAPVFPSSFHFSSSGFILIRNPAPGRVG